MIGWCRGRLLHLVNRLARRRNDRIEEYDGEIGRFAFTVGRSGDYMGTTDVDLVREVGEWYLRGSDE